MGPWMSRWTGNSSPAAHPSVKPAPPASRHGAQRTQATDPCTRTSISAGLPHEGQAGRLGRPRATSTALLSRTCTAPARSSCSRSATGQAHSRSPQTRTSVRIAQRARTSAARRSHSSLIDGAVALLQLGHVAARGAPAQPLLLLLEPGAEERPQPLQLGVAQPAHLLLPVLLALLEQPLEVRARDLEPARALPGLQLLLHLVEPVAGAHLGHVGLAVPLEQVAGRAR